jgi:hypothetical protein
MALCEFIKITECYNLRILCGSCKSGHNTRLDILDNQIGNRGKLHKVKYYNFIIKFNSIIQPILSDYDFNSDAINVNLTKQLINFIIFQWVLVQAV